MASIRLLAALLAGLCAFTTTATATDVDLTARLKRVQSDTALSESLFKTGRKVAAVCAHCHGEGGNSVNAGIPNLAGQNPAFLIEQLRKFEDGRRVNEFMQGMIKAMNSDEKIGIVLFYSSQKVTPQPAIDTALIATGKTYYDKICWRCHSEDGRSDGQFARIAGQQPEYLSMMLKRYRAGSIVVGDPLMAASTRLMTDEDIEAVVAYVSSIP